MRRRCPRNSAASSASSPHCSASRTGSIPTTARAPSRSCARGWAMRSCSIWSFAMARPATTRACSARSTCCATSSGWTFASRSRARSWRPPSSRPAPVPILPGCRLHARSSADRVTRAGMRALLCSLIVASACGGNDAGPTGPITAHATHYDLSLDLDTRAAHSKVTLVADVAGDCLTLPFRAASLTAVAFDGQPGDGAQNADTTLTICGDGVAEGKTFTVEADDTVPLKTLETSQGGCSISNDVDGNKLAYLVSR